EGETSTSGNISGCSNTPTDMVVQNGGNGPQLGRPINYWNCGNWGNTLKFLDSSFEAVQLFNGTDVMDQVPLGCPHSVTDTEPPCWRFQANENFSVQFHIKVGTW